MHSLRRGQPQDGFRKTWLREGFSPCQCDPAEAIKERYRSMSATASPAVVRVPPSNPIASGCGSTGRPADILRKSTYRRPGPSRVPQGFHRVDPAGDGFRLALFPRVWPLIFKTSCGTSRVDDSLLLFPGELDEIHRIKPDTRIVSCGYFSG